MPINTVVLDIRPDVNAQFTAPASVIADWQQVGSTLYLNDKDAPVAGDPITNPDGQITASTRQIFRRDNRMGTLLGIRMVRNTGLTILVTSPVVKVFGRTRLTAAGSPGAWQVLRNRLGDASVTLVVDPVSDITNNPATLQYTTADPEAHYFDTQGCNEFLVGVETPFGASGAITTARLEVKII